MNQHHLEEPAAEGEQSKAAEETPAESQALPVKQQTSPSRAKVKRRTQVQAKSILPRVVALGLPLVAASAFGAAIFFHFDDDLAASSELPKTAAAYRATGFPWTAADIAPHVPDSDNAADYLRIAGAEIQHTKWDENLILDALQTGNLDGASELLAPTAPALNVADIAAAKSGLDFHRDWDAGPGLLFPELANVKALIKAFSHRAELEAAQGDAKAAAHDLLDARRLAALIGQEPTLISVLVQISGDEIAQDAAQRAAASLSGDADGLRAIRDAMSQPLAAPGFIRAMRGEAYFQVNIGRNSAFQDPRNLGVVDDLNQLPMPPIDPSRLIHNGLPSSIPTRAAMDRILQAWTEFARYERADPSPLKLGGEMDRIATWIGNQNTTSYRIPKIIFPIFAQAGKAVVKDQAQDLATRALLKALIQRAETGRFPSSIDEIPGKWIDPFTGKPMKLLDTGETLRIYSLGPKLKDFNGTTQREASQASGGGSTEDYNVGAVYPPVPRPLTGKPATPNGMPGFGASPLPPAATTGGRGD